MADRVRGGSRIVIGADHRAEDVEAGTGRLIASLTMGLASRRVSTSGQAGLLATGMTNPGGIGCAGVVGNGR
jgi:hypothetical protein